MAAILNVPHSPLPKLWIPRRVLATPEALAYEHGRAMVRRASDLGSDIIELKSNRLTGLTDGSSPSEYANAKTTLAVVVSPPGARQLQPIPPSADWQFHLAKGCPAHCQYCYLAGSLPGAPVTRAYANMAEILEGLNSYVGTGTVTSQSVDRSDEGTTFEASCYTDPLGIEHITGSLAACIRHFGIWSESVQLRWTTKFDGVGPLLTLPHNRRTRVRFSVNAQEVARNFEGGTASVPARIEALRRMAAAGYPVGLTIAPIMPVENWREQYSQLLKRVSAALNDLPSVDLSIELITHRFTPKSKLVLLDWYPKTKLELSEDKRSRKMTKFGSTKYVYPNPLMREMHEWFNEAINQELPRAHVLYWT